MPKVSVIIPVYNTERYLRECLDSVVNQTLRDIEIICVDDGSTDESPEILREYQAKDERITILRQEKSNAGAARNLGLSIARGEYLSFLDSDDFFEPMMLEHMYACAKDKSADIVVCEMKLYYEDTGEAAAVNWHIKRKYLPEKEVFAFCDIKGNAFRCICSYLWDKLIKRDIVIKNNLRFQSQPLYNDGLFVYKAMMSAERITILDEYLVYNRRRSSKDSITNKRYLYTDCAHSILSGLKEYLVCEGLYERYKRDHISYAIGLLHHTYLGCKNDPAAAKEMRYKIDLWLCEYEVKGHDPDYYYDLTIYRHLLKETKTRSARVESARLLQKLGPLGGSKSYRLFRYIRKNGLHRTFCRVAKKVVRR